MEHLRHNTEVLQGLLPKTCELMPAVKANAYGHGDVLIGRALQNMGIRNYCVATAEEGAHLRRAGVEGQILVLGYTHPQELDMLLEYGLTQTVVDASYAKELASYGKVLKVHVGIDTGMRRLGERSEHLEQILDMWNYGTLQITGVFSHLCTSDGNSKQDREFVKKQEDEFRRVLNVLKQNGIRGFSTHLQGSYGILNGTDNNYDYARPGIALYGVLSRNCRKLGQRFDLRPVLSLKARIGCVKEINAGEGAGYGLMWRAEEKRILAVAAIGYADGIPRGLSNRGYALVRGKRAPIAGRICMDQLLLDVTDIPFVSPGDEAVFIGKSEDLEIKTEEMAAKANTISNEILSRLGQRLERIPIFPCS